MPLRALGSPRGVRVLSFLPPSAEPIDTRPVDLCEFGMRAAAGAPGTRGARVRWGLGTGLMFRGFLRATSRRSSRTTAGCGSTVDSVRSGTASETAMSHSTRMRLITLGTAALVVLAAQSGRSQTQSPPAAAVAGAQPAAQPATLIYANRPIVVFRATVLWRTPAERAAAAVLFIDRVV